MTDLWEVIDMDKFSYENCEYYPPLRDAYRGDIRSVCLFDCHELTQCLAQCVKKREDYIKFRKYIREEVMKQMD